MRGARCTAWRAPSSVCGAANDQSARPSVCPQLTLFPGKGRSSPCHLAAGTVRLTMNIELTGVHPVSVGSRHPRTLDDHSVMLHPTMRREIESRALVRIAQVEIAARDDQLIAFSRCLRHDLPRRR